MKKFLVVFALLLLVLTVSAEQKNPFKTASVKRIDGVTAMVSGLDIRVKADADSLKKFVKNDFYKAFNIGRNVEPELLRAVKIGDASIYKFVPFYKGIKVDGVYTVVTMRDGKIDKINNGLSDIDIDITKMISEKEALKSAMAARNMKSLPKNYLVEKIITRNFGKFVLAYKIRFSPVSIADSRYHIVDALTGKVIRSGHSTFFAEGDDDPVNPEDPADSGTPDTGDTEPDPVDTGDTEGPVAPQFVCKGKETDKAKIWKFNPFITPELTEVELPWVAPWDDSELAPELVGSLITEKDKEGIRKIKSYNCPDDGTKINIDPKSFGEDIAAIAAQFGITDINVHACHPMPLANKCEKGSFIYNDCESGHEFSKENMTPEKIDRCAEISMYYHASKIYDYIRSLYTDIDSENEFYLQNNDKDRPLNVIANFVTPDFNDMMAMINGTNELVPMDNAFFTQSNFLISMLLKDFDVKGDLLVFGQGTKADMGYDGDVVYHEFGHATIYTTGIEGLEFQDKYGLTVEPGSLHEGMADTFAFIMTDNTCTGEYASEGFIKADQRYKTTMDVEGEGDDAVYCMRSALNKNKVFEDFVGEVHFDGKPFLASNWDIYQLIKGNDTDTQKHRDNMMKLMLKTLYQIGDADVSYKLWAETLMAEVEKDENFKGKAKEIRKILEDRNFFEEIRARSLNKKITDAMYIPAGESEKEEDEEEGEDMPEDPTGGMLGGGSGVLIKDGDKEVRVGPAYIQFYYDVPADLAEDSIKLKVKKIAKNSSDSLGDMFGFGSNENPKLQVYYRKGAPIEYSLSDSSTAAKVKKDGSVSGTASKGWVIPKVEKGERYYLQFVNVTGAAAAVNGIEIESAESGEESETAEEDEDSDAEAVSDDEMSYGDDEPKEEGKKSSGCSLVL